jgi:hypothetical protein
VIERLHQLWRSITRIPPVYYLVDATRQGWTGIHESSSTAALPGHPRRPPATLARRPAECGYAAGTMFWFTCRTFSGSYFALTCASRS